MAFDLNQLVRENIRDLVPYSSARGEFAGEARVFLDANENSFGSPLDEDYSRYPDPVQTAAKRRIAELKGTRTDQIFIGNGSDEAIDLLFRVFCRPGIDNVIICPPTYGMYEVAASINDVEVRRASLTPRYELDHKAIRRFADRYTKLIFICSPNNPTGNLMSRETILTLAGSLDCLVVVDEAYIDFAASDSLLSEIDKVPNLVILQTFSKAWGLAGARVGMAFADRRIIDLFNKVKPPYNVSGVAQDIVLDAFEQQDLVDRTIALIKKERELLARKLAAVSYIEIVYPSDANFLLVKTGEPKRLYQHLIENGIVVRDRSDVELCEGCLRITVGTPVENESLLEALNKYEESSIY